MICKEFKKIFNPTLLKNNYLSIIDNTFKDTTYQNNYLL